MDDRIAALEGKVADMQLAMEQLAMKHFSLKRAFSAICGNMAGALGVTPDHLRSAHVQANSGTIWYLFPGLNTADSEPSERFTRQSDTASKELEEIFTWLMNGLESYKAAQPPEPIDRFVAMANAISAAGVQLAENQRYRLATILLNVNQKLATAAGIEELQGVLIFTDVHGDHSADPEEKARFQNLSEFIRQRIRDLSPRPQVSFSLGRSPVSRLQQTPTLREHTRHRSFFDHSNHMRGERPRCSEPVHHR